MSIQQQYKLSSAGYFHSGAGYFGRKLKKKQLGTTTANTIVQLYTQSGGVFITSGAEAVSGGFGGGNSIREIVKGPPATARQARNIIHYTVGSADAPNVGYPFSYIIGIDASAGITGENCDVYYNTPEVTNTLANAITGTFVGSFGPATITTQVIEIPLGNLPAVGQTLSVGFSLTNWASLLVPDNSSVYFYACNLAGVTGTGFFSYGP